MSLHGRLTQKFAALQSNDPIPSHEDVIQAAVDLLDGDYEPREVEEAMFRLGRRPAQVDGGWILKSW